MKQKLITKNQQVKLLINQFNRLQDSYILMSVDILTEIMNIRRKDDSSYNLSDLENEKGLEQHKDKIRPLLRYPNVSDKVKKYLMEGKITNSTVFYLANMGHEARKPENQDKIVEGLVKGSIKEKELTGEYHLLLKIGGDTMGEVDKIYLETIYHMKTMARIMGENEAILRTPKAKKLIKQYFSILQRRVKEMLK